MFDEIAREAFEHSLQHEPDTISAEELADKIARLEKEFGLDYPFAKMMKEQLDAINTGKSTRQLFLTGHDVLDLQNLPFDPAEAAGEASLRLTEKDDESASRRAKPK